MGSEQEDGTRKMDSHLGQNVPANAPRQAQNGSRRDSPSAAAPAAATSGVASKDSLNTTPAAQSPPAPHVDTIMTDASPDVLKATSNGTGDELSAPLMTMSTSASSHASQKDAAVTEAKPYGTRSRGRPRGERPNYAEDVEMDFEFQHAPAQSLAVKDANAERNRTTSPGTNARPSPGPALKKTTVSTSSAGHTPQPKDAPIPGTSSFAANPNASAPATAVPKKRKAATNQSPMNGGAPASAAASVSSRKAAANSNVHFRPERHTNMFFFEKTGAMLDKNGSLVADDGTVFSVDDNVYMVCEPPGEPYYLGRIMQLRCFDNDDKTKPVENIRINWYYRPRDVGRLTQDTRLLYATMHSDMCPLTSLRGKIQIRHRSEVGDLDDYRKQKDSFWFEEVFDRFIHRYYRAIPTADVINVPDRVKKALDERWKYIVVEQGKIKELTTPGKNCIRCKLFAPPDESVECAICKNMYHMQCVRPALTKKPSRGFGWSCAPCSRAAERKLEARNTPIVGEITEAEDEEEMPEEDEPEAGAAANTTAPSQAGSDDAVDLHPGTQAEIALAKMWPMRYLGIHCRPEDALQYDDRAIYPRASSRLGPRHQANVNVWHGRPVEFVKPAEIKKRYGKNAMGKKDAKGAKDAAAAIDADKAERAKRPKWVMDEPPNYVRRGEDLPNNDPKNTAKTLFKMPTFGEHSKRGTDDQPAAAADAEGAVDRYMKRAKAVARAMDIGDCNVDFLDFAVKAFYDSNYDEEAALKLVRKIDAKKDLQDPNKILTPDDKKRFAEGVAKYGSELRNVRQHMNLTNPKVKQKDVVRYWYHWKKTPSGREVWTHYGGRKGAVKRATATDKLADDIADDHDDSAFDVDKARHWKRGFSCKFCASRKSRQWRRAPGIAPGTTIPADGKANSKDKSNALVVALCDRCASFWRRYAIKWEDWEEVAKKVAQGGTKQMRRRIDDEILQEFRNTQDAASRVDSDGIDTGYATPSGTLEPVKKKQKLAAGQDAVVAQPAAKQKPLPPPKLPTPPPPPIIPAQPKFKELPCAVCHRNDEPIDPSDPRLIVCTSCKLTVHTSCYGVGDPRGTRWTCDTCTNDRKERVSYDYSCVLCPVSSEHLREWQLVAQPKLSHKKKGEREREKERLERELADNLEKEYIGSQLAKGRPTVPREAIKRTTANNWVHVTCAVWTPETRFVDAQNLDLVEAIPQIPPQRRDVVCRVCKERKGACVPCHGPCNSSFHVECAKSAGYTMGFDITPVKSTARREGANVITLGGETGAAVAAIWCSDPKCRPKSTVHHPNEIVDVEHGISALQRFVAGFKQADLTLTGTTRKANLLDESAKHNATNGAVQPTNRRESTIATATSSSKGGRVSGAGMDTGIETTRQEKVHSPPGVAASERHCDKCNADTSPRWFETRDERRPVESLHTHAELNGDTHMANGTSEPPRTAQPDSRFLCNKCHWRRRNNVEEPLDRQHSGDRDRDVSSSRGHSHTRSPHQHTASPLPPSLGAPPVGQGHLTPSANLPSFTHNAQINPGLAGHGPFNQWRDQYPQPRPVLMTGPPPPLPPGRAQGPAVDPQLQPQHPPPPASYHTSTLLPPGGPPPPGHPVQQFRNLANPPPHPTYHPPLPTSHNHGQSPSHGHGHVNHNHNHVPPPLQLQHNQRPGDAAQLPAMVNGLPSPNGYHHAPPQHPQYSPTQPPPNMSRQGGSPHFGVSTHLSGGSGYGGHGHGSPPPPPHTHSQSQTQPQSGGSSGWRPNTPRDAPDAPGALERRDGAGGVVAVPPGASAASASPNLRNLLS